MSGNLTVDGKVTIDAQMYHDMAHKAALLDVILKKHPELVTGQKLTSTAKKYKKALSSFVKRVDEVLSSEDFKGIFQIAYVHGFTYKGQSLAQDIEKAKKLLGE